MTGLEVPREFEMAVASLRFDSQVRRRMRHDVPEFLFHFREHLHRLEAADHTNRDLIRNDEPPIAQPLDFGQRGSQNISFQFHLGLAMPIALIPGRHCKFMRRKISRREIAFLVHLWLFSIQVRLRERNPFQPAPVMPQALLPV